MTVGSSHYLAWLSEALALPTAATAGRSTPKDLVLGYATGYEAAKIAPFVRSLREVYDGPVVLVVDERQDVLDLLAEHGVEAIHPEVTAGWEPHAVMSRFAAYCRVIEQRPETVDVFLTDVRDVIFQADPFAPAPRTLEVFVEDEGRGLGDHAFNIKHLTALVGETLVARLADKPCLCVGTVMGPRDEVLRFCRILLMLAAIPRSEVGGAFGADQAACNLAVHLGLVKATIRPNFGRVATLGTLPDGAATVRDGVVVNPDGTVSAIVHQHDRDPKIDQAMHERWGQGLQHFKRVGSKTAADRRRRWKHSLIRRLPEWR